MANLLRHRHLSEMFLFSVLAVNGTVQCACDWLLFGWARFNPPGTGRGGIVERGGERAVQGCQGREREGGCHRLLR